MLQATPAANAIAQHLLDYEATRGTPAEAPGQAAVRVCEQLRVTLSQLVGVAGFRSLLLRALTLARREVPWLTAVEVTAEGALKGFGEGTQAKDPAAAAGGHALLAQLLGLLHTLIGEALTVRLLAGAWPTTAFDTPPPSLQENAR